MKRPQSNTSSRRPGFSMAELMIAIVILGLGMLMVATMFPVAWTRARDMAEFTTQTSVGDTAAVTVEMATVVGTGDRSSSFFGDIDSSEMWGDPPGFSLVHQLNMETALAVPPTLPIPLRPEFFGEATSSDISMDRVHAPVGYIVPNEAFAKIPIHARVIPQLPPAPVGTTEPALRAQWEKRLAGRRFAWSVFHRFDNIPTDPTGSRSLTMYYVTLRRPESTNRYARQDGVDGVGFATKAPKALLGIEDVQLPVPWLVNLDVRGSWKPDGNPLDEAPTGIPSEAIAGGSPESKLIAQMLQEGSILIDRITGAVYTVTSHRYTKNGSVYDNKAVITLDREVQVADLDPLATGMPQVNVDAVVDAATGSNANGTIRPFWTFPPPIERTGSAPEAFVFSGKQPVVGVEIRPLTKHP